MPIRQQQPDISVNNPFQNIGQITPSQRMCNLPDNPSVQDLNAVMIGGGEASQQCDDDRIEEPAFGEHVREAAGAIRRMFKK